jgi:hypothetical protein
MRSRAPQPAERPLSCANARLFLFALRIVEGHLVVPARMGGKRAMESGDDDLRDNLAVVCSTHRQAGDELLRSRSGETEILQLPGAPRIVPKCASLPKPEAAPPSLTSLDTR